VTSNPRHSIAIVGLLMSLFGVDLMGLHLMGIDYVRSWLTRIDDMAVELVGGQCAHVFALSC